MKRRVDWKKLPPKKQVQANQREAESFLSNVTKAIFKGQGDFVLENKKALLLHDVTAISWVNSSQAMKESIFQRFFQEPKVNAKKQIFCSCGCGFSLMAGANNCKFKPGQRGSSRQTRTRSKFGQKRKPAEDIQPNIPEKMARRTKPKDVNTTPYPENYDSSQSDCEE